MNEVKLNEQQQEAVNYNNGPLRIIAGPGSGKTRTIVEKIINIMENAKDASESILVITFTNKAVAEIKERLKANGLYCKNIFTYHGFGMNFLSKHSEITGIDKEWKIIDTHEFKREKRKLIKKHFEDEKSQYDDIDFVFKDLLFENIKVEDVSSGYKLLWREWTKLKESQKWLTFDDLIFITWKTLKQNKSLRKEYLMKYKFVMVDEFQDTNRLQYEIIKSITNIDSLLTIVGDVDQNIYSWRGAESKFMLDFDKDYPTTKTIHLATNYRSVPDIITAANKLIKHNAFRESDFEPKAFRKEENKVVVQEYDSPSTQAEGIAKQILEIQESGGSLEDVAVIVRISSFTRMIESAFKNFNVPYKVIGAFKFFDRKEIRASIELLNLLIDPSNNLNLSRVMTDHVAGIGPKTIEGINDQYNGKIYENQNWISNKKVKLFINTLTKHHNGLINPVSDGSFTYVGDVLWRFMEEIGFLKVSKEDEHRIENIKEFVDMVKHNEKIFTSHKSWASAKEGVIKVEADENVFAMDRLIGVNNYINNLKSASAGDEKIDEKCVSILTAHASKGTEFENVFIPSFEEGHWPARKSDGESQEEERRVAYVGITRAKTNLNISFTRENKESRFLFESGLSKKAPQSNESFPCHMCSEGNVVPKVGKYGEFFGCDRWPECTFTCEEATFASLLKRHKENKHKEEESVNPKSNLVIENHKVGSMIDHRMLGIGKILSIDEDFIDVQFENTVVEILIGHNSYKIIK